MQGKGEVGGGVKWEGVGKGGNNASHHTEILSGHKNIPSQNTEQDKEQPFTLLMFHQSIFCELRNCKQKNLNNHNSRANKTIGLSRMLE